MPGLAKAQELRAKRANLVEEQRAILAAPAGAEGSLSAEQRAAFDKIDADINALKGDIDRIERHEASEAEMAEAQRTIAGQQDRGREVSGRETADQSAEALRAWLIPTEERSEEQSALLKRSGFRGGEATVRLLDGRERRALSTSATAGGDFIPQGFRNVLEQALLAFGGVRKARVTVLRTASGNQMDIPTSDDTGNVGALLAENTEDSEQDVETGAAVLDAYKYTSKIVRVSKELLQDSAFDIDSWLGNILGERIGRALAAAFTTGTGTNQPAGVVTGSTLGVTAAATATVTTDELIDLYHAVDPAYRASAEWMLADAMIKVIRKLKDGDNQYMWQPGLTAGAPDMLYGKPVVVNQSMASPAAAAKTVLFGDFSKFLIRDVLDVSLVRMVERYADYHQVGFVAISRHDSVLVDAGTAPIKHLIQAAA